jgi:hypothetical protein
MTVGWRASRSRQRRLSAPLVVVLTLSVGLISSTPATPAAAARSVHEHDVTAWAPPSARPLSDAQAAALVTRRPESQPANTAANRYVPTNAELAAFHAAQRKARADGDFNPLTAYVTGRPGLADPSTDDLIQWVSHKWAIPTNWIRAQMVVESGWSQAMRGDLTTVGAGQYAVYPGFSRVANTEDVYQSLGIAQVKWIPQGSVGIGTEPLRWESTAFNLDYYAATVRYFYAGDCGWCSTGYHSGQTWKSIGAWDSPQPWGNKGSRGYIAAVRAALAKRAWTQPGF